MLKRIRIGSNHPEFPNSSSRRYSLPNIHLIYSLLLSPLGSPLACSFFLTKKQQTQQKKEQVKKWLFGISKQPHRSWLFHTHIPLPSPFSLYIACSFFLKTMKLLRPKKRSKLIVCFNNFVYLCSKYLTDYGKSSHHRYSPNGIYRSNGEV